MVVDLLERSELYGWSGILHCPVCLLVVLRLLRWRETHVVCMCG